MQPDDEVCLCYHVTLRKLVAFARRERPRVPSLMSECLGAGTGCGWCIPYLTRIAACQGELPGGTLDVGVAEHAAGRRTYLSEKKTRNEFCAALPADGGACGGRTTTGKSTPDGECPRANPPKDST